MIRGWQVRKEKNICMRPTISILDKNLIEKIISEAREVLCKLGLEVHNEKVVSLLSDHGAHVDKEKHRVFLTEEIIDKSLILQILWIHDFCDYM
ncbi:MAG: hypothetical protein ACYS0C_06600 [Planctomycetota bacterium]|jgi:trimethylamine:corrinoid methyltransferase-like protein